MMNKDYWPDFWKKHGKKSVDADEHFQVLRTKNKAPIEDEQWTQTLDHILQQLDLKNDDDVLDLCCGSGLITRQISKNCRSVTCVDIAPELVDRIDTTQYPNIRCGSLFPLNYLEFRNWI